MSKVYAIHEGCKYEGGGVSEIYADKENAIKFAFMLIEEKKKNVLRIFEEDAGEWEWKEIKIIYPESKIIKLWQNPIDEVIVYEYEVK